MLDNFGNSAKRTNILYVEFDNGDLHKTIIARFKKKMMI